MFVSDIEIFLKKKKKKKRQYGRERYKNLLEDEYKKFFFSRMQEKRLSEYKTFFIISILGWSIKFFKKV